MNDIEYIRKYPENIHWIKFSAEENMSEDFIREFQTYIFWWILSCNSNVVLSESFIREFRYRLDIGLICGTQKLSKEFIVEFINFVNFDALLDNDKISDEVKNYVRMFI